MRRSVVVVVRRQPATDKLTSPMASLSCCAVCSALTRASAPGGAGECCACACGGGGGWLALCSRVCDAGGGMVVGCDVVCHLM